MEEKTLVIIKPHAIRQNLYDPIIKLIEMTGFEQVAHIWKLASPEEVEKHYHDIEKRHGRDVLEQLISQMTSSRMWVAIFRRDNAVQVMRDLIGATDPAKAAAGTIRNQLAEEGESLALAMSQRRAVNNVIHASASKEDFEREFRVWFPNFGAP